MTLFDVLLIALIQGLGEALPLGASGHLAALPMLAGTPEGRAALSVAAHVGILLALAVYFWRDVGGMAAGIWRLLKGKPDSGSRLFLHVLAGTVPAAVAGWYLIDRAAGLIGPVTVSALILGGGVLLLACDKLGVTVRRIEHMGFASSTGLGLLQIAALIPGVSRTGAVITMARLLGWERQAAARFSLLLAMPLILGHAGFTFWTLSRRTEVILSADLAIAAAAAGAVSLLAVAGMMAWVERRSFAPLAVLRILFGLGALVWALWVRA
ncbi:undecaprenyl-diphosphate phosphatase [Magnetospirillum sp. SS-4]|uniref:undecaprenyl-diphosphate phosphatase n=1 Tax=Magnetospirillum sp. SS-4 TaxID=2681465 RepID=UPI001381A5B8|nr:undecaprenyl-diphosphate phosphatase [Magnetospirillum sp. SS-4]CAA7627550.1 Undecaprenyl-diphosphatase 1 [Magnetospirillum sp. SS-4]